MNKQNRLAFMKQIKAFFPLLLCSFNSLIWASPTWELLKSQEGELVKASITSLCYSSKILRESLFKETKTDASLITEKIPYRYLACIFEILENNGMHDGVLYDLVMSELKKKRFLSLDLEELLKYVKYLEIEEMENAIRLLCMPSTSKTLCKIENSGLEEKMKRLGLDRGNIARPTPQGGRQSAPVAMEELSPEQMFFMPISNQSQSAPTINERPSPEMKQEREKRRRAAKGNAI